MNVGYGIPVTKINKYHMMMYRKYGPIWKESYIGFERLVVTTRPEDAEK